MVLCPIEAAQPPAAYDRDRDHHVRYDVLVRHHGHWDTVGTYRDRDDAQRAAWHLRHQGKDVRVEVERGRWEGECMKK